MQKLRQLRKFKIIPKLQIDKENKLYKTNMNRLLLVCALWGLGITALHGQHPAIRPGGEMLYEKGLELLHKEQWGAARHSFEDYLAQAGQQDLAQEDLKSTEAKYYVALSALHLYNDDAEVLAENFIREHENHPKAVLAYYELGRFYYNDKKYNKAASYFEKVNSSQLTQQQRNEVDFSLAYTYFSNKQFDKALEHFNRLKRSDNRYTYASSYYAGYIYFTKDEYDQAIYDLQRAEKNEAYAEIVPSLIANIYYRQGQYDKLISYAGEKAEGRHTRNRGELDLLTAEAYYKKEQYHKAAERFEAYAGNRKMDDPLQYRLAYAQYKSGAPEKAIENFKPVANNQDSLGQHASYYLGVLYVQEGNKPFAQTAFKRASELSYNSKITEESSFKLAKLHYELGDFQQAAEQLKNFTSKYASSKHKREANELLSKSLLNSNDYAQAIAYIEKMDSKSPSIRQAYQQVTFLKGTELFNDAKFYQAVQMLEKSLEYPQDKELVVKANYWMGEAYSIGKKWNEAINAYANVFRHAKPDAEFHLASRYGIGYAYYNSKQYDRALTHFREYVNRGGKQEKFYNDAVLRLADSYYANKIYHNAITHYEQAIRENNPEQDYAYFQLGLVYSLTDRNQQAFEAWNTLLNSYSRSPYFDDALFNKAQLQLESGQNAEALQGFNRLQQAQPNSPFIPYALRSKAIAFFNLQEYEQAAQSYKQLLNEYSSHQTANSALIGLQEVLALQNKSDEFDQYLARYKEANPSDKALESVEYEAAKTLYFSQQYEKAIQKLQNYIRSYPSGSNTSEAKFYLAESFYRLNQSEEALAYYTELADKDRGTLRQRAMQRVAELQFRNRNYREAIQYYRQLANTATNNRQQSDAWTGLMESFYMQNQYDSTSRYANLILNRGAASANVANRALLYKGKAAYEKGNYSEALQHFNELVSAAKDENGAEAKYMIALIQHHQQDYMKSVETLFEFNSNYSMYRYWLGKSFILIAENYRKMGETFQAQETLKSIIQNSKEKEIVEEAKAKLQMLEEQEDAEKAAPADTSASRQ
jgi:tetratricopeptide (TPR) repeat protein